MSVDASVTRIFFLFLIIFAFAMNDPPLSQYGYTASGSDRPFCIRMLPVRRMRSLGCGRFAALTKIRLSAGEIGCAGEICYAEEIRLRTMRSMD